MPTRAIRSLTANGTKTAAFNAQRRYEHGDAAAARQAAWLITRHVAPPFSRLSPLKAIAFAFATAIDANAMPCRHAAILPMRLLDDAVFHYCPPARCQRLMPPPMRLLIFAMLIFTF